MLYMGKNKWTDCGRIPKIQITEHNYHRNNNETAFRKI